MKLQMWEIGEEYVIAESIDDVKKILFDEMSCSPEDYEEGIEDARTLNPESTFRFDHQGARGVEERTVKDWIEINGRGYFAGPI